MGCPSNKDLQCYLEKNGFYSYLDYEKVSRNYKYDLQLLLSQERKKTLKLPTSWKKIKDFGKARNILIIELGGSFLRIFEVEVLNHNKYTITKDQKINFSQNHSFGSEELFTKIAQQLDTFVEPEKRNQIENAVLVFSYALDHYIRNDGLPDGIGQKLEKMSQYEKLSGIKIGETFQNFLWARDYPNLKISVVNDTIANLLSAKAIEIATEQQFDLSLNILVSNGVNVGLRFDEEERSTEIINSEFGNFKNADLSYFDRIIKDENKFGDDYLNEKMISGNWQHLVMKVIIKDLIKSGMLSEAALKNLKLDKLDSEELEKLTMNSQIHSECMEGISFLWKEIIRRASTLCGLMLAVSINELYQNNLKDKVSISIIESGAILDRAFGFRGNMIKTMNNELQSINIIDKTNIKFYCPSCTTVAGGVMVNAIF